MFYSILFFLFLAVISYLFIGRAPLKENISWGMIFSQMHAENLGLNWKDYVVIDEKLKRPSEVDYLQGDASKAKRVLGYEVKTTFKDLIKIMIEDELRTS